MKISKKFYEKIYRVLESNEDENEIESTQAKLRNKLGPFWNLSEMISDTETFERLLSSDKGKEIIINCAKQCLLNKSRIIELIKITEENA